MEAEGVHQHLPVQQAHWEGLYKPEMEEGESLEMHLQFAMAVRVG